MVALPIFVIVILDMVYKYYLFLFVFPSFMTILMNTGELDRCKYISMSSSLQEERRNKHEVMKKTTSVLLTSSDAVSDTWWARSIWGIIEFFKHWTGF